MHTDRSRLNFDYFRRTKLSATGFVFATQVAAFWVMWRWLGLRVWTSAEERWGLLALAAAIFFAFFWTKAEPAGERKTAELNLSFFSLDFLGVVFFTLIYAASFAFAAPPLVRAILAMTALTFMLSRWRFGETFNVGLYGLLLLALPSVASLQFYLGYPLRVVVGKATAWLLQMQGLDVWREGVCLHFGEKLIWIDAPCSGIKMLWFGIFLAAFLALFYRLSNAKTVAVFTSAFLIIVLGNVFRASALFYIEAEIVNAPEFMHEAIGVFSFVFVALGIVFVSQFWQTIPCFAFGKNTATESLKSKLKFIPVKLPAILLLSACAFAALAPLWFSSEKKSVTVRAQNFRAFPQTFEGLALTELPLSEREKFFLEDFPGTVGRFSDGKREIVVRFVTEATRKLHPATDCFRAIGYQTKPLPLRVDGEGKRWSCFSARKSNEDLNVCERIYDKAGNEWTDVSAWYWAALSETDGEWSAITVAERK